MPSPFRESLRAIEKPRLGMKRERVGRIDRERRHHRKDVVEEVVLEPGLLRSPVTSAASRIRMMPTFSWRYAFQLRPAPLLVGREARRGGRDLHELLDLVLRPSCDRADDPRAYLAHVSPPPAP